jgi:hypothetical protein
MGLPAERRYTQKLGGQQLAVAGMDSHSPAMLQPAAEQGLNLAGSEVLHS